MDLLNGWIVCWIFDYTIGIHWINEHDVIYERYVIDGSLEGGRNTMENATKALEMAGSLLIGVLLLGCLLFAYTRMSELKDTEHKVEVSQQAQDFNQDYETYNRNNLYGSDLFSLANQIEDYNKKKPMEKHMEESK